MLFFLYGKDTYRLQQKLKEIENHYRKIYKNVLNLEKISADQIEFKEFWDTLQQTSIFVKKKLFFLENLFSNPNFKQEFLIKIKEISQSSDIIVIFEKTEVKEKDKLVQTLKKVGKSQEFKPLNELELKDWIIKEFQRYKIKIDEKIVERLINYIGRDLWQMSNEIKKLVNYKKNNNEISEKDIDLLIKPKIENDIFKTIEALANKEKNKTINLIQKHLEKNDSASYLLSMINFQFRNILIMKLHETNTNYMQKIEMHPYVARKALYQSQKFTLEELKKIYQKIFKIDLAIKTGKIDTNQGLYMLIAEI